VRDTVAQRAWATVLSLLEADGRGAADGWLGSRASPLCSGTHNPAPTLARGERDPTHQVQMLAEFALPLDAELDFAHLRGRYVHLPSHQRKASSNGGKIT
jgi:hypothetical protein